MVSETRDELIARVKALYRRVREGTLQPADIVPFTSIEYGTNEDYLEKIFRDRAEFDRALAGFGSTYDVFRVFGEEALVLDVGAHWGYSVVAMRHQGCRARIASIEAMPFNIPALERLSSIDDLGYECVNVAASNVPGELTFYVPVINGAAATGLASTGATLDDYFAFLLADLAATYPPKLPGQSNSVGVAIKRVIALPLDEIVSTRVTSILPVAAVKMDVEGHEGLALSGGASLFRTHKPLLMLENANRDPVVVEVMLSYGYFHAERRDGRLFAHVDFSYANDGFWLHRDRVAEYRRLGIFDGGVPSPEEASRPVEARWNARDGFV